MGDGPAFPGGANQVYKRDSVYYGGVQRPFETDRAGVSVEGKLTFTLIGCLEVLITCLEVLIRLLEECLYSIGTGWWYCRAICHVPYALCHSEWYKRTLSVRDYNAILTQLFRFLSSTLYFKG